MLSVKITTTILLLFVVSHTTCQRVNNSQIFRTVSIPDLGKVKGKIFKSIWTERPFLQFFDVPYAESPSGELRFKSPEPVVPWRKVRDATRPSKRCATVRELHKVRNKVNGDINPEDCLYLSISTRALTKKLPVMVYIHGNFLNDGSGLEASPGFLMEKSIVLVSVKYRLGPFGFLSTMTDDIPGNAGVKDVILALEWIQENIKHFGGDPENVTIFGQAGGAALINVLTMSPAVREGLFHRVIYQSGAALTPAFLTSEPLQASQEIGVLAGCPNITNITDLNNCFMELTSTEILKAYNDHLAKNFRSGVGYVGGSQIVIGGPSGILPIHPGKILAAKTFKQYPTMGGVPKNVGSHILKNIYVNVFNETIPDDDYYAVDYINLAITQTNGADPTLAWINYAKNEFFTDGEFNNGTFEDLISGLIDLCGTIAFKNPLYLTLQANSEALPNSTYLYSFDYHGEFNRFSHPSSDPLPFDQGVSLSDENLYLFPWPQKYTLRTPDDLKVAKRMVSLWTSFATTGVPQAPGMMKWHPMEHIAGPYLKIDRIVSQNENFLDEYAITVKEATLGGYSLVNDDFFSNLVEISREVDFALRKFTKQV